MGRYTTVQAYADNNPSMRSVPYEQATGAAASKKGGVRPEKVDNPYGSTAGAGSGEFHVYRHARSREIERMNELDREEQEGALEKEFQSTIEKYKTGEEKKTEKRKKKRQRQKEAKRRKMNLKEIGVEISNDVQADDGEEFHYEPIRKEEKETLAQPINIPNDGSFLEMMKKMANNQGQENKTVTAIDDPAAPEIKNEENVNLKSKENHVENAKT